MSLRQLLAGGVLAWALAATDVRADDAAPADRSGPTLLVRAPTCEHAPYDAEVFVRLLAVELTALGVGVESLAASDETASARLDTAPALVTLECGSSPGTLVLRLADMATRKELTRETEVATVPEEARPRALALAVVALVESSWSEAAAGAEGGSELPPDVRARLAARLTDKIAPARAQPTDDPATSTRVEPSFEASAALRVFPSRSTGLVGVRVSALPRIANAVRLALDLEALWGESELADAAGSIGTMSLYWLNAGTGIAWRVGRAPMIEIGPRVQLGYAHADAHVERDGARADDDGAFVLSVLAAAAVRVGPSDGPWASLGLDLGHTPIGIIFLGDQARLSGMADTTMGTRIGLAW